MKRAIQQVGGVSGGMLLGAVAAFHGVVSEAMAVDLDLDNFRVVYEHTAFNGTPPAIFSPPHASLADSAHYSLRGLSINPTGGTDGEPSVYVTSLHGMGSRWIHEFDLSALVGATAPTPNNAARLFSDFTTRQSQPKSLAIDDAGWSTPPSATGPPGRATRSARCSSTGRTWTVLARRSPTRTPPHEGSSTSTPPSPTRSSSPKGSGRTGTSGYTSPHGLTVWGGWPDTTSPMRRPTWAGRTWARRACSTPPSGTPTPTASRGS